jgi:sulfite reductase alpha subunit-like flavoprotein
MPRSGLPNAIVNGVDGIAESLVRGKIYICYCSNGTTALKLAEKLHKRVKQLPGCHQVIFGTLNSLHLQKIGTSDIVLMVISTTGHGCFPANGTDFEQSMDEIRQKHLETTFPVQFSIYGVGDSAYPTFNAAAVKLNQFWIDLRAIPIGNGLVKGDVAVEALPLSSFNRWWNSIECFLTGKSQMVENDEEEFAGHGQMICAFKDATLLKRPEITREERIVTVSMDIGNMTYEEMSHLRLLPWNSSSKVARALSAFGINDATALVPFKDERLQHWNYRDFFTHFVDLEGQFRSLDWTFKIPPTAAEEKDREASVLETLERYGNLRLLEPSNGLRLEICLSMPLLRPRSFSVASSGQYLGYGKVELLIKTHNQGRFSNIFLSELNLGAQMKYAPISKIPGQDLLDLVDKPLIVISTGTGFAPIRSLLQKRICISKDAEEQGKPNPFSGSPISLFAGFKAHDQDNFSPIILAAKHYNVIDMFFLVPSNEQKKRVQDYVEKSKWKLLPKLDEGFVYVCGNAAMAKATAAKLSDWVEGDVNLVLGRRYVEEIF